MHDVLVRHRLYTKNFPNELIYGGLMVFKYTNHRFFGLTIGMGAGL